MGTIEDMLKISGKFVRQIAAASAIALSANSSVNAGNVTNRLTITATGDLAIPVDYANVSFGEADKASRNYDIGLDLLAQSSQKPAGIGMVILSDDGRLLQQSTVGVTNANKSVKALIIRYGTYAPTNYSVALEGAAVYNAWVAAAFSGTTPSRTNVLDLWQVNALPRPLSTNTQSILLSPPPVLGIDRTGFMRTMFHFGDSATNLLDMKLLSTNALRGGPFAHQVSSFKREKEGYYTNRAVITGPQGYFKAGLFKPGM